MPETEGQVQSAALRLLWEHHWWSFEKLLEEIRSLSREEFERDLGISYRSLHGAAAHLTGSEQVWLKRVVQGESVSSVPGVKELPDLKTIEETSTSCRKGWEQVLQADDLERIIQYSNTRGEHFKDPLWRVMTHLLDHSAAYRGILITGLRLLARTPPATGVITYTRRA